MPLTESCSPGASSTPRRDDPALSRRVITRYPAAMPRWEQGSKERLQQAAIELFEEQGFEDTSAVQIAKRARVTTRTFFRYFGDKQEVLFADENMLREALVEEIRQATDVAEPLQAVTRILAGFGWADLASRDSLRRREAMIASTPYLRERELIKQHQMADEFSSALQEHGVDPGVAGLAGHVGVHVFRTAYRQWVEGDKNADLASMTDTVLSCLAAIMPANTPAARRKASTAMPKKRVSKSAKTAARTPGAGERRSSGRGGAKQSGVLRRARG